jgi:hypothetical protein
MSKYVLKETKETCKIMEYYFDLFGEEMYRIKTESGEIREVKVSEVCQFLQD